MEKACAACKAVKPAAEYGRKGEQEHGRPVCRACNTAATARSRERWAARKAGEWLLAAVEHAGLSLEVDPAKLAAAAGCGILPREVAAALASSGRRSASRSPFATELRGVRAPEGRRIVFCDDDL